MSSDSLDARLRALARQAGVDFGNVEAIPADVGRRRYYRLDRGRRPGILAVVYPADEGDAARRWLAVRNAVRGSVRVPDLLAEAPEGDLHLIEDFGPQSLAETWMRVSAPERSRLLSLAAQAAAVISSLRDPRVNPPFTASFFLEELRGSARALFAVSSEPASGSEMDTHEEFASRLSEEIAAHPSALLHRDFHLSNLFEVGSGIGVIDFQDARVGPDSYDLASLGWERETLIRPDPGAADGALRAFQSRRTCAPGLDRRIRRVSLQRAWKAAGTFARAVAAGRESRYGEFLRGQIDLVLRLLGTSPAEREFAKVLGRRSARMHGKG